jgi:hypothetical protein
MEVLYRCPVFLMERKDITKPDARPNVIAATGAALVIIMRPV